MRTIRVNMSYRLFVNRFEELTDRRPVVPPPDAPGSMPKYPVQSPTGSYEVVGVDAIWHNQYAGPEPDFIAFRTQYQSDINAMILKVAEHVRQGFYTVISINATPHMLTVICACEKMQSEFPADFFDEPEGV